MDRKSVKNYISENLNNLFSFAYLLIPDELFAQQLAVDSLTHLLCTEKQESLSELSFEKEMLRSMYVLATKRIHHLTLNNNWLGSERAFIYQKSIDQRAILFLKDSMELSFHDIAFILNISHSEAQSVYIRFQLTLSDELVMDA